MKNRKNKAAHANYLLEKARHVLKLQREFIHELMKDKVSLSYENRKLKNELKMISDKLHEILKK
jgi:hypothetical protein